MTAGGDRTIPATPRRREAAREQGLAPTAATITWPLLAALVLVALPWWARATITAAVAAVRAAAAAETAELGRSTVALISPTAGVVLFAFVLLVGIRLVGDGAGWRLSRAGLRFERIDPIAGLRRLTSATTWLRGLLATLGLVGLLGVVWSASGQLIAAVQDPQPAVPGQQPLSTAPLAAAERFLWWFLAAAAVVAVAQWFVQRISFERRIKMTPTEFREEMLSLRAAPKVRRS